MRVIAGIYRSRLLKSLPSAKLRPTSDRLRETLFNVLGAGVSGSHFVDLFAGTGAVGIEAISRGAAQVLFVENHAPTARLIRQNLESLAITKGATILPLDALRALEKLSQRQKKPSARQDEQPPPFAYDYIFLDPPYAAAQEYVLVMEFLSAAPFVSSNTIVIAEHSRKFALAEQFPPLERAEQFPPLERVRLLQQGDAVLSFYRLRPPL